MPVRLHGVRATVALLLLMGCATSAVQPQVTAVSAIEEFQPQWAPHFKGIDIATGQRLAPILQQVFAVRIDLHEPGIEFFVTPSNGERPAETDGMKTSDFLAAHHCQLAINASPFSPVTETTGDPKDILGISMCRGELYSKPRDDYGALIICKDNKAVVSRPPFDLRQAYNAVGGFGMLLEKGNNVGKDDVRHPRTAVGVSPDGRYLYLLVIDGRQPAYSLGATTRETAQWLAQLGARDALNLDGGGSTELVIGDQTGAPRILNRPIHNNIPGNERINGNSLGIYAPQTTPTQ